MASAVQAGTWVDTVMFRRAQRFAFRLAWALLVIALGCARRARTDRRAIELQLPGEITELDPRYVTRGYDVKASRLVHAGLVELDPDTLDPRPALARSIELKGEHSIAVELKPNVRFHSGQPLRPADVCATLQALRDPKVMSPHRSVVGAFGHCQAIDDYRLEIILDRPRATWLTDLEVPILRADQVRLPRGRDSELDGLGPFEIAERTASDLLLSPARYSNAHAQRPVVIRTVREENARVLRLLAGQADITVNAISPTLLPTLAAHGMQFSVRPGSNLTYMLVQNDRAPFNESRMRRALSAAIDRVAIVEHLLAGKATVARWALPPSSWATPAELAPLRFEPRLAADVLRGRGPVTILTSPDRSRLIIARAIAQMLNDAGLETSVEPLDFGVMLSRLDAGSYSLALLQIPELSEPHVLSWFFHPRGIPGEGTDGRNRAHYRSVQAGELLDIAGATMDREQRRPIYARLAQLMLDDMPIVPLWHEDQVAVVSARVAGFSPSATGHWASLANVTLH